MPVRNFPTVGGLVLVADVTAAANTNSVLISSTLDLDVAKEYVIFGMLKNLRAGSNEFLMNLNGDASNYNFQYLIASSTTVSAGRSTTSRFAEVAAQNDYLVFQAYLKRDISGATFINSNYGTRDNSNITTGQNSVRYSVNANITRIDIVSGQAGDNIAAGSRFMIFKVG